MIKLAVVVVMLFGFGLALAGCNDDGGGGSLESYFAELGAAQTASQERTPEPGADPGDIPEDAPIEEVRRLLSEGLTATRGLNDAYLADVDAIDPPGSVEDEHEAFVASIENVGAWLDDMIEEAATVESLKDFDAAVQRTYPPVEQGYTDACLALQTIADDNAIDVDLGCTH